MDLENKLISVEEGDWILVTGLLPPPSMEICASSTISQRLVVSEDTFLNPLSPSKLPDLPRSLLLPKPL